jgi:rhodanese-related sulfurtransferase
MKTLTIVLLFAVLILIGILTYNYFVYNVANNPNSMLISPQEAKSRRFGLILDVRTHKERELYGEYPNSVIIPFEELTQQSISDLVSKDTSILIYCKTGRRAGQAALMLKSWGFKNVKYINQTYNSMMPPGSF